VCRSLGGTRDRAGASEIVNPQFINHVPNAGNAPGALDGNLPKVIGRYATAQMNLALVDDHGNLGQIATCRSQFVAHLHRQNEIRWHFSLPTRKIFRMDEEQQASATGVPIHTGSCGMGFPIGLTREMGESCCTNSYSIAAAKPLQ
jgi:hypothetical protein